MAIGECGVLIVVLYISLNARLVSGLPSYEELKGVMAGAESSRLSRRPYRMTFVNRQR